ncbi:hypothetical protein COB57_04520 [Candidatus Peregrinibacteria bacterium]|nr:MAG: hypothetical protein COB57_04520 [Candidatus Peregrinibacteria bacterium]
MNENLQHEESNEILNQSSDITDIQQQIKDAYQEHRKTLPDTDNPETRNQDELIELPYSDNLHNCTISERNNKDTVLAFVNKNGLNLKYASLKLQGDEDVVKASVSNNGRSLKYAKEKYKKYDKEMIILASKTNDEAAYDADKTLFKDNDFLLDLVENNKTHEVFISFVSQEQLNNKEFCREAVQRNAISVKNLQIRNFFTNKELIQINTDSFWILKTMMLTSDEAVGFRHDEEIKDLILEAIEIDPYLIKDANLEELNLSFKKDFIIKLIETNKDVFKHLPTNLKNDPYVKEAMNQIMKNSHQNK